MKTFRKKIPQPIRKYSPVALVKKYGDYWHAYIDGIDARTSLAIKDQPYDRHDALLMNLMERGVIGRV